MLCGKTNEEYICRGLIWGKKNCHPSCRSPFLPSEDSVTNQILCSRLLLALIWPDLLFKKYPLVRLHEMTSIPSLVKTTPFNFAVDVFNNI